MLVDKQWQCVWQHVVGAFWCCFVDSADRQQLQELVDKLSTENVSLRDQLGVIKLSLQGKVEKEQNMAR